MTNFSSLFSDFLISIFWILILIYFYFNESRVSQYAKYIFDIKKLTNYRSKQRIAKQQLVDNIQIIDKIEQIESSKIIKYYSIIKNWVILHLNWIKYIKIKTIIKLILLSIIIYKSIELYLQIKHYYTWHGEEYPKLMEAIVTDIKQDIFKLTQPTMENLDKIATVEEIRRNMADLTNPLYLPKDAVKLMYDIHSIENYHQFIRAEQLRLIFDDNYGMTGSLKQLQEILKTNTGLNYRVRSFILQEIIENNLHFVKEMHHQLIMNIVRMSIPLILSLLGLVFVNTIEIIV